MDKKIIIFLSCLLIAIPLSSALASFIVPPQKESVQGIAVTKAVIPTDVVSPTPTLFISQQTASRAGVTIPASPAAGLTVSTKPTKAPRSEIKATVTLIPTITETAKPLQSTSTQTRLEPTPTIYTYGSTTPAPTTKPTLAAKPTVAAKQTTVTGKPSTTSVMIVENPSTVIVNEFSPTQVQVQPQQQIDTDANLQGSY